MMLVAMLLPHNANAQDTSAQNIFYDPTSENQAISVAPQTANGSVIPSVFLTKDERAAIQRAISLRGVVRPVTQGEVDGASFFDTMEQPTKPPPEERNITLNGIVYNAADDWTIWLNGKRYTPDALPEEVIDLNVTKEYIEIEWFDEYSRQIYPIRLRSNQRFNIDTRIFLPG